MVRIRLLTLFTLLTLTVSLWASRVETKAVHSDAMNKDVNVSIVLPEAYGAHRLPVVYLLHGYGDNHERGYLSLTDVRRLADNCGIIVVIPDADTSWYFDSPIDPTYKYETFVATELVNYTDKNYYTLADRRHRATTGLSMGGHGALYLAIRHQDTFGAAGSMSGGVDFRPFSEKWDIKLRLGEKAKYPDNWDNNTVISQLPKLKNGSLQLIIDCGTEDFFFEVNNNLHNALISQGIAHEYTTRPGNHSWDYWRRSLRDHFYFFADFFGSDK